MFDFKNSTKNYFNFKNSLEVFFFFSRTDWNFLIQEQTEILFNEHNFKHRLEYLFQEKSERFGFKNDWKQIGSFIRLEFVQEQTGSFDFFLSKIRLH